MLLLLLAFLLLAAPAQAAIKGPTPALKLAVVDGDEPIGGMRVMLFVDTRGRTLRFDARTLRIARIPAPRGCSPVMWDGRRDFLFECSDDETRTYRLLRGGRGRTKAMRGVRRGDYFDEFGRAWVCGPFLPEGADERADAHQLCVNRRSGRRVTFAPQDEDLDCGRDVDREDLRPYTRCTYVDPPESWRAWRLDSENALLLWRKGGRKRTLLEDCSVECDGRLVDGRVSWWTEAGPRTAHVHLLDVRSGRRWRWRVKPIVPPSGDIFGSPIHELHTFPTETGLLILRGRRQFGDAVGPYDLNFVRWP